VWLVREGDFSFGRNAAAHVTTFLVFRV